MPRPHPMSFDSQHQMGLSGGLPNPGTAHRPYVPYIHPMSTPHARPWSEGFPQIPGPPPVPIQPNPLGMQYVQPNVFSRQTSENELGQGQSAVTLEPEAQLHFGYPLQHHPVHPMSQLSGPLSTPLPSAPMPMPPVRRPSYHSLSAIPPRASRVPLSPPFATPPHYHDPSQLPPHTHRRSGHSRARRSVNNRLTAADMGRDLEENGIHDAGGHRSDQPRVVSQSQGVVGTANGITTQQRIHPASEKTTSRFTRSILEKVNIQDLPETERTCVICYNDYGVKTPEGINEDPLRLPKCKHVFGNHCLARWFEDSNSCPYCRDKIELPPKHPDRVVSQLFTAMMSARHQLPPGASEEMYLRLMSNLVTAESLGNQALGISERRPFQANGDSDSSSYDEDTTSSASSRAPTATSPVRTPSETMRDTLGGCLEHPNSEAHIPPLAKKGTPPGSVDFDYPSLSPLHAQQPDDVTQASSTIPSVNGEVSGDLRNAADIHSQAANTSVASTTVQNRIRPW
ncbi:hypothetical protein TrVFT333_007275 [Trichoderma virens FT-333]|nr:hypothetical protein TrVFT333_007275 [Trichoderma virens FT-333]